MWINKSSQPLFISFLFSLPSFKVKAPQAATPSFSAMPIPFQRMAEWSELLLHRKLPRCIFFPETESKAARAVGQGAGDCPYTRWVTCAYLTPQCLSPIIWDANPSLILKTSRYPHIDTASDSPEQLRWSCTIFFHEISSTNAHDQLIFLRWIHRVYWTRSNRCGASIFQVWS